VKGFTVNIPVEPDWRSTVNCDGANILITGGTGSFGRGFVKTLTERCRPERILVYSRDEMKQLQMRRSFPVDRYPCLHMFIGDVRDRERLYRVMEGIDIVVHAAALKVVPVAEYNAMEAIKTNIFGAANIVDAATDRRVSRVVALSTDKAANPVNLYGATKLCADKLVVAANATGLGQTLFSAVRYGNVVGSRGSVVPLFLKQRAAGTVTITDERMTRFWLSLEQGVRFVMSCIEQMEGGEVFVPKIPSTKIVDLANAIVPNAKINIIGIRPGEKVHEVLISEDEARNTVEREHMFIVKPPETLWERGLE
jgi:UDP-N-acetylglucosamine 4,6-dehydratase